MKKKMTVKEFAKKVTGSFNRLQNSIKKHDREKTSRFLYIAALDRLESDADYRSVQSNPAIPQYKKEQYKARREKEVMMDIEREIKNGIC